MTETPTADKRFMERAMLLAMRGRGSVEPNPTVGCVIVKDGQIVGEGYHERYGGPHAEPNALTACRAAGVSPQGATAYVTLEPCCHSRPEKKTPPCVPALVAAKLARVVIGCQDPNPEVCGGGITMLRKAGIEVEVGVLGSAARQLIAPYTARVVHHRPYITLKWAQSADGCVAGAGGQRVWITNPVSTRLVHELRARCDVVLVGINTVLKDDPLLTARVTHAPRQPIRGVLDTHLRMPLDSEMARSAFEVPVYVYTTERSLRSPKADELREAGVELFPVSTDGAPHGDEVQRLSLPAVIADLYRKDVTHVLVEPGPLMARSFLELGLVDRVWVFRSPNPIGAADAPRAPAVDFPVTSELRIGGDVLTEYLNPRSPVFFSLEKSTGIHYAEGTLQGM